MNKPAFRALLIKVATDPEFAADVGAHPDIPVSRYGLTEAEARVIAAAVIRDEPDDEPQEAAVARGNGAHRPPQGIRAPDPGHGFPDGAY